VDSRWVVLKFGGTSVSSAPNWHRIAGIVRARRADGLRVLIVHSALSGVTDRLERLLDGALARDYAPILTGIEDLHRTLAAELGVAVGPGLEGSFDELRRLADGIAL